MHVKFSITNLCDADRTVYFGVVCGEVVLVFPSVNSARFTHRTSFVIG